MERQAGEDVSGVLLRARTRIFLLSFPLLTCTLASLGLGPARSSGSGEIGPAERRAEQRPTGLSISFALLNAALEKLASGRRSCWCSEGGSVEKERRTAEHQQPGGRRIPHDEGNMENYTPCYTR